MTSQGHPRTIFRRALERGNLLVAETTAREVGQVSLSEALELTALIARSDSARGRRAAVRWLGRYLASEVDPTFEEVLLVVGCLAGLAGPQHAEALVTLRAMAERATRPRR